MRLMIIRRIKEAPYLQLRKLNLLIFASICSITFSRWRLYEADRAISIIETTKNKRGIKCETIKSILTIINTRFECLSIISVVK